MSITSLDGAIAGMKPPYGFFKFFNLTPVTGTMYSLWNYLGSPGKGDSVPTGNKSGQFFTSAASLVHGQLPFSNPGAGSSYLAVFNGSSSQPGTLVLADRIWADSLTPVGIGMDKNTVYSGSFPRSAGIASGDSSGSGVLLALEVFSNNLGTANATAKVTYIGSDGSADTQPLLYPMPTTAIMGTFIPFNLGVGKFGVRAVVAYDNMTTMTGGCLGLVAYRPLAQINCVAARIGDAVDSLTSGFPILFNNTVPFLIWIAGNATGPNISGAFVYTQG